MLDDHTAAASATVQVQPHDFCGTGTEDRLSAWLAVLDLQVELFLPAELAVLESRPGWAEAHAVLDVGCGNGRYLAELSRRFPAKRCTGLETSPEFVAAARRESPGLKIIEADYFACRPDRRFDIVLMRFVVQHLDDWPAVLDRAGGLLTSGGSLVVIEPDVAAFANTPPLPHFTRMLALYGEAAGSRGRLRANLDDLAGQARDHGWQVADDLRTTVENRGAAARDRVSALYRGWASLCRQCGYVDVDYAAVDDDLARWSRDPGACSTIGLRFLDLRPA